MLSLYSDDAKFREKEALDEGARVEDSREELSLDRAEMLCERRSRGAELEVISVVLCSRARSKYPES
ncbi:hypothetical protein HALLA_13410 [Halostagnicola larsenii XH-48]|uniref:Uncharacterized protein n=1 Tax=Halostagnicola larsenii XH-48 TaxID=797299 RepID=W0JVE6_9EURY|nr:hypothetical protein HALLA_13410 [Halostagnicola larsenii XH-48]